MFTITKSDYEAIFHLSIGFHNTEVGRAVLKTFLDNRIKIGCEKEDQIMTAYLFCNEYN